MRAVILVSILASASCAGRAKHSVALYEAGDYAGAAKAADDGLASHPDDAGLWQMRVRAALALGDADGVERSYASYRGHLDGDDRGLLRDLAVATLGQALSSPSAKLKIAAIQTIAAAELQLLADDVAERLGDDDDRVAAAAAAAVLRGYPQAPQVANEMLHSHDAEARRLAIDGIGKKVGALAKLDLEKAASSDPDPGVRRAAIRWLGQLKDAEAVELLTRQLAHPDDGVRAAAATALARIGQGDLVAFAHTALGDRAIAVRSAGVDLLAAAKATDELVKVAQSDRDPIVAAEAALAARRGDLAAAALDRAAGAEGWTIRAGAANIATRTAGKTSALALAKKLLADTDARVRLAAARVLAHNGDAEEAIPVFAQALAGPTALSAATDLADLGDPRGLDALDAMVRDSKASPSDRAAAASAHRAAHHVTPGLVAALADANGVVRVEAASAIVMLSRGGEED